MCKKEAHIMDSLGFLEKILSSSVVEKHIGIVFLAIIIIFANVFDINIQTLTNMEQLPLLISVTVLIFNIICLPSLIMKLNSIDNNINKYIEIATESLDKNDTETILSKLNSLVNDTKDVQEYVVTISNQIKGIPNISTLNLLLTLRSKELWNNIFKNCIKSVTNYKKNENLDNFNMILADTLRVEIQNEKRNYVDFFNEKLSGISENIELINKLCEFIDNSTNSILIQIDKNISDSNKLFLISLTLQNLERDLIDTTTEYLRNSKFAMKN